MLSVFGRQSLRLKHLHPMPEDAYTIVSELFEASCSVFDRSYAIGVAF